jgi:hypothetical protein
MRLIILVAKWPDQERLDGGDREDVVWRLTRDCQGAVGVHVYEATAIMHDVRYVTAALEPWQARGGSLSEDAACTSPRALPATWDVVTPPWAMCSALFSVATA